MRDRIGPPVTDDNSGGEHQASYNERNTPRTHRVYAAVRLKTPTIGDSGDLFAPGRSLRANQSERQMTPHEFDRELCIVW
jgi:hypothetical protein